MIAAASTTTSSVDDKDNDGSSKHSYNVIHSSPLMISTTTTSATMMMTAPACPDDHDTQPHHIDAGVPALVSTPLFIFYFFSTQRWHPPSPNSCSGQPQPQHINANMPPLASTFFMTLISFFNTVWWPHPSVNDNKEPQWWWLVLFISHFQPLDDNNVWQPPLSPASPNDNDDGSKACRWSWGQLTT